MELGVYTAVLHDRPLTDALATIRSLGLIGAEMDPSHLFWQGIDPDMAVNIEHEDVELSPLEGLQVAAELLRAAAAEL